MSRSLPLIEPLESRYAPATLSISLDSPTIEEGTGGTKTITFKVTLSEAPTERVTVDLFTRNGTAISGEDFDFAPNTLRTLTFNPAPSGGQADLEQEISIVVTSDTKFETDEDFQLVLHNAFRATLANGQPEMGVTATIDDDDAEPTISIGGATITEGDIPGTPKKMAFTVSLSNPSHEAVSVVLNTADGTAVAVGDYVARLGQTITFAPGETSKTFEVDIIGDAIGEAEEAFTVTLSNPTNGTLSGTQNVATGKITNDDAILRVSDVRIAEGTPSANTGNTVDMVFTVVLDRAGKNDVVTVHFETVAGSAGLSDYTNVEGDLTFNSGETSKQIIVKVNKDAALENDETVVLDLSDATNAYIEDGQAIGTIANDEISASLKLVGEGTLRKKESEFNAPVIFNVTLSSAPTDAAGVDVVVLLGGAATAGKDYEVEGYDVTDGKITVHFNPGDPLTKEIRLTVTDDQKASDDEIAQLSISSTKNAVVNASSSQGSFTILNDDAKAYLIVEAVDPVAEGDGAKASVTVRLSAPVEDGEVTFSYNTLAGTAKAGSDFVATSGTGKITNGISTTIEVPLAIDDLVSEKDETFTFQISGGTGGATASSINATPTATITITDGGDPLPTIGFDSTEVVSIVEGDSGTKIITFKLTLSGLSTTNGREVSVRAQGVSGTATSGQDFVFDKVIKIAADQTETTFTVEVNGDTADEIDENFFVQLSEADGATIGAKDKVEVKILNNDRHIFIEDVVVSEGSGQATFKIKLNAASLHPVTVKFKTSNGTAIGTTPAGANDDYVPSGDVSVTFAPGQTEMQVTVNLVGDFTAEDAETFFGEIFEPTNAAISVPKATATITNDDPAFRISDGRLVEGGPGATGMMVFMVKREGPATGPATVKFVTQNGTAVQGQDFTQLSGTLEFAAGVTEMPIFVQILGDASPEGESENFSIKLSEPSTGTLVDDTGVGTIVDDEGAVVTITDQQIVEGDNGTQLMAFIVTVTGSLNGQVKLNYATIAGTATTADFTNTTGTLTFSAAGSQTILVPIIGDLTSEGDQEFTVKLTPASGSATVNLADDTGVGTIEDNEGVPQISVVGGKVVEGNSGETEVRYLIKLDRPSDKPVTVDFALGNTGTAMLGADYTGINKSKITFLPGQTEVYIAVKVNGDTVGESDETIVGELSDPTNATLAPGASTSDATIQNDEILATISNGLLSENGTTGKLTINLSGASTGIVKVSFVVNDGTAIKGTDYSIVNTEEDDITIIDGVATITFRDGETSKDIFFTLTDDTKFEGDETFSVKLTDAENAAIDTSNSTGTFTIDENETLTISVSDQYVFEGETAVVIGTPTAPGKFNPGPFPTPPAEPTITNVQITVTLSNASERAVTVKASSLLDGETSALANSDFKEFMDREITFAPGETSKTFTVEIIDNQVDEAVETFKVKLTDASLGDIAATPGKITILDNDLRGISIGDVSLVEGKSGTGTMTFTITLSAAATQTVTVKASTIGSSAESGVDFLDIPEVDQLITFNPGETSKTVTVTVNGDNLAEGDELFAVELTDASGAIVTDARGEGRIVTDEIVYKLTSPTTVLAEDGTRTLTYTVTRAFAADAVNPDSELLKGPGSVTFTTVDGTAKSGGDYAASSGALNFPTSDPDDSTNPNDWKVGTFTITINNDTAYENDETFLVRLTGSTGGALANASGAVLDTLESTITIDSEDAAPTLSIANVRQSEGFSGTSTFVFTVTLSAANEVDANVTVDFNVTGLSATSVLGGGSFQDFVAQNGKLTFAPGETTKTISVTVNGDNRDEPDEETFQVKLSGSNVGISTDVAIGTIVDDDAKPKLFFGGANNGDLTIVEGNDGFAEVTLTLKLSNALERNLDVNLKLISGTAEEGVDYIFAVNNPVTIAADSTEAKVTFRVEADRVDELNESFQVEVELADGSQGLVDIQDSTATITITDDDAAPQIVITDALPVVEGNMVTLEFTVTINGISDRPITIDFATLNGTAIAGGALADYEALSGTLTFEPGATGSQTITVRVLDDVYKESNETLQVKLSNAVNATIARDTGTGTIEQDDDSKVILSINDVKITEGQSDTKTLTFTVQLSAASDVATVFNAATINGTAIAFGDYTDINQEFTIPAGSTSVSISVTIKGDRTFEATEYFTVKLTDVSSNVEVFNDEGRGTIYNDDIQVVNSRMIRYVDVDGDLVTLKITKGALFDATSSIFKLVESGSFGGQFLQFIDFRGNPKLFSGTSLYVTAEPQAGFVESGGESDGKADVGFIFGASVDGNFIFTQGIDFTNIVISGDLGGIQAGDNFVLPSIRGKLVADSIGAKGSTNLPEGSSNVCYFLSKVNAIQTTGDVNGFIQVFGGSFGDIGSLTIGGALQGLSEQQIGRVVFSGSLGKATIGKMIGGATNGSGSISASTESNTAIGSIRVLDGIVGGSGEFSGSISARSINFVGLGSNPTSDQNGLVGGSGEGSGSVIAPRIGKVVIGTEAEEALIKGGSGIESGRVRANSLGSLTVFGDIIGGEEVDSGQVFAEQLGSVRVVGSLIGGSKTGTGVILTDGNVNSLTITGGVTGGTAEKTGYVEIGGSLNSLTIGSASPVEDGDLVGGSAKSTGFIEIGGSLGKAAIHGDLRGGSGSISGGLKVGGAINSLTIGGDFVGGGAASASQSGFITADRIARMTISGDWIGGTNSGVADSGTIRVARDIGVMQIAGDVLGTASSRVVLAAGASSNLAIGSLSIGGKAEHLDVLGGYGGGATSSKPIGNLVNADAVIKSVTIGSDVLATNIVAGVAPGPDGRFGTGDDALGLGASINNPSLLATIAKVTIKGAVGVTTDAFGIVAQHVVSVSASGTAIELLRGASNDKGTASKPIGGRETFKVLEI